MAQAPKPTKPKKSLWDLFSSFKADPNNPAFKPAKSTGTGWNAPPRPSTLEPVAKKSTAQSAMANRQAARNAVMSNRKKANQALVSNSITAGIQTPAKAKPLSASSFAGVPRSKKSSGGSSGSVAKPKGTSRYPNAERAANTLGGPGGLSEDNAVMKRLRMKAAVNKASTKKK